MYKLNIPEKVKVAGSEYDVIKCDFLKDLNNVSDCGLFSPIQGKLYLSKSLEGDVLDLTFIHEIIEAINDNYGFGFEHEMIGRLEHALHQVFKDNNINFNNIRKSKG